MAPRMKQWELRTPGLDALRLVQAERPVPGPGEVLVRTRAVALNYRDGALIDGAMGAAWDGAMVPGSDMAGEVVALGQDVRRFAVGDRVITVDNVGWIDGPIPPADVNSKPVLGRLAEYVAVPAAQLVAAPLSLDAAAASTLPVAGLTAWFAVVELGAVRAGQTLVVQGTGGVSLFALQFAVAHGARVIVTSSSDDKLERALALGASDGINRVRQPEWQDRVLELTGGRGAEHILEMAGGDNIARSLEAVSLGGRVSIIGLLDEWVLRIPTMPLLFKRATLAAIAVGHRRALEDMVRAIDHLRIKPVIDRVYDFRAAPEAFAHLRRGPFGKVVITLDD
ncbi:zinc-dependent alcohol dehydrogenase family protein [Nannocystis pusilla]|uniref:NAD(P)-dependent alcohol dehydrogenase n=1 Tax=Nannocystis pusilla TaxID=889268 RepID=A0ABS7THL8_9BACT|nr:NAD(P)-dependent alcohol dehydrogenase [Nannocystis pusilla]MBZ5707723.1 NAD(P)-dependent alcohol dehydrogenase [Nannocystis pusilla]